MASSAAGVAANKPSFAKVAAMAPPPKSPTPAKLQTKVCDLQSDSVTGLPASISQSCTNATPSISGGHVETQNGVAAITEGLDKLNVVAGISHHTGQNGRTADPGLTTTGADDSRSHLSNSSTKPASFDTKSLNSENTFAMEEKESLRPDDSASVQATDEDESVFVPPRSSRSENQCSSEGEHSGPRRLQDDRVAPIGHVVRRLPIPSMVNPPRFGEMIPNTPPSIPLSSPSPNSFAANQSGIETRPQDTGSSVPPDERLIEAMGTPKDRLLLLQLEEKFLAFITQSKEITLDLPPQNSYERLLAHKLADYYCLNRYNAVESGSIRLYKAADFRLPVPLGELCRSVAGKDALPSGPVAVKIMRRTVLAGNKFSNDGSTAESSSAPSKATSENGAENTSDEGMPSPPQATPSKVRSQRTREEREAHYKAARERIFGDFQEAPGSENSTGDTSADMSRSNSVNGKKKAYKQRTPRDDSFEARSSYVPAFPGMTYAPQNQHNGAHAAAMYPSSYGSRPTVSVPTVPSGPNAGSFYNRCDPPATAFPGLNYSSTYTNQYGSSDGWTSSQSPPSGAYYNFTPQPAPGYGSYGFGMPSSVQQYPQVVAPAFQPPQSQWGQSASQNPGQFYQSYPGHPLMQPPVGQNGAPMPWGPNYPQPLKAPGSEGGYPLAPMAYQQYPATSPPPHSQHPLPGSYNHPPFNPQIRSFVPQVSPMRYGAPAVPGRPTNPSHGGPSGYGNQNAENPDPATLNLSPFQKSQESLQKKWGTPSHLPKKPPPSQIPSTFEMENTPPLPSRQSFSPTCA